LKLLMHNYIQGHLNAAQDTSTGNK